VPTLSPANVELALDNAPVVVAGEFSLPPNSAQIGPIFRGFLGRAMAQNGTDFAGVSGAPPPEFVDYTFVYH
jgi:hypothetical protein